MLGKLGQGIKLCQVDRLYFLLYPPMDSCCLVPSLAEPGDNNASSQCDRRSDLVEQTEATISLELHSVGGGPSQISC